MSHSSGSVASAQQSRVFAYGAAVIAWALLAISLLRIPIQLSDSFTEFLAMQSASLWSVVRSELAGGPYFRPLRRALIKIIFDLSGGNYYYWFRGFHALELLILFVLFVRMLRIHTRAGAAVVPLALAMVAGMHTFADILREAFPVNHFLTIAICCVAAVNLAQARASRAVDVGAILLLAFAMFTIESGLLVWVVFVTTYFVGYRGISHGALLALTGVFAAYFVIRFGVLGGDVPSFNERDTGFGLLSATPAEIQRIFGANPWPFYLYNVASAISCVLFAEPRSGTWYFVKALVEHNVWPWQVLTVVTSTLTTVVLARYAAVRFNRWRRLDIDEDDRLVVLFIALLPANAVFAAVYEKDVILSVAGVFYAAAAAIVFRRLLIEDMSSSSTLRRTAAYVVALVLACGWSLRFVSIEYRLREVASIHRNDWAYYDAWERKQATVQLTTTGEKHVRQTLYDDAIWRRPAPPMISSRLAEAWSDPEE